MLIIEGMSEFDLGEYWHLFPRSLKTRYGSDFEAGFVKAKCRFDRVRETGDLTVDDVMAIFSDDLPFVHDWTMPDRTNLKSRMKGVPELIRSLGECGYDLELIREIWKALRELSLTSLVLHHVYPDRFAMCSHHLASLLGVTASTVPEYYAKYCEELSEWTKRRWRTPYEKSVVNTEFALWTWYRHVYDQDDPVPSTREERRACFFGDRWIQWRRARQLADEFPTEAAMIAWREFETVARYVTGASRNEALGGVLKRLQVLPADRKELDKVWKLRNDVLHDARELETKRPGRSRQKNKAHWVLDAVERFIATQDPNHF